MIAALKRGLYNGIAASAILLALPLAWRLGMFIGGHAWLAYGEVWMDPR